MKQIQTSYGQYEISFENQNFNSETEDVYSCRGNCPCTKMCEIGILNNEMKVGK